MSESSAGLRHRRRAETQRAIQGHAIRLFTEHGFESTTVAQVAAAAGVAPMTVYRHFPTKEDLVLVDQQHELIAERLRTDEHDGRLVTRIGRALTEVAGTMTGATTESSSGTGHSGADERAFLLARLRLMISTPALRARHLDTQYALQQTIVDALRETGAPSAVAGRKAAGSRATTSRTTPKADPAFERWAAAGVALAALNAAVMWWAEQDGRPDLVALIEQALRAATDS